MTLLTLLGIAVVPLAVGIVLFRSIPALSAYFTLRGKRLITCPETHATTIEWNRFRPEQLSKAFSTHKPVCWEPHCAYLPAGASGVGD